ncbi:MAG TPA: hypothetical protein VKY74_25615, partial [Chloroflexia bacterium]|nr:hypothetical protein [Chloroflexia bacterium]
ALGSILAHAEQATPAARVLGAAAALLDEMRAQPEAESRELLAQGQATARAQLGEEAFRPAWAAGQALGVDAAVALALRAD